LRIAEDKVEFYVGLGLIVVGFILGIISFTGATLGKSWFFGQYASSLQWAIGIIAVLLFVTGIFVLIFKSND
jgi:1,4-dihydroxy-2-naphthoate octaprenyltransferase